MSYVVCVQSSTELQLCCAQCNTPITEKQFIFSMSVDGSLTTHMNPAGYVHDVLTVSNAKNFNLLGLSSTEFSWFPGWVDVTQFKNIIWIFCVYIRHTNKPVVM